MVLLHTKTEWVRTHSVLVFMTLIMYYMDVRKRSVFIVYNVPLLCQAQIDHTNADLYEVLVGLSRAFSEKNKNKKSTLLVK